MKGNNRLTLWARYLIPRYLPKRNESVVHRKTCLRAFIALLIIAPSWKQLRCSSVRGWINKLWFIHTTEYCSAIKRKKLLIYTIIQINFKGIVMSERRFTQNAKYCVIPFRWSSRTDKTIYGGKTENWIFFFFQETAKQFSKTVVPQHFLQHYVRVPVPSYPCQHLVQSDFKILVILIGIQWF